MFLKLKNVLKINTIYKFINIYNIYNLFLLKVIFYICEKGEKMKKKSMKIFFSYYYI